MHGDAIELGVERREQPHDLAIIAEPQFMQGPRAIFATTPGEENSLHEVILRKL